MQRKWFLPAIETTYAIRGGFLTKAMPIETKRLLDFGSFFTTFQSGPTSAEANELQTQIGS